MPGNKVFNVNLNFPTSARGAIQFVDLSETVQKKVTESGIVNGIVHVFAPHATGVLILTENDSGLLEDIRRLLETLVPANGSYQHPINAHSHLRSMLLPPDKTLPVVNGRIAFGIWQSLMFVETDTRPRNRTIIVSVLGS